MRRLAIAGLIALTLPASALAETCGPMPDRAEERAELFEDLRSAETLELARIATDKVWSFWTDAPDARSQSLIDRIFERRAAYDNEAVEAAAEELVLYCPAYAEGWNQLAIVLFVTGRYDASLSAIDEVLDREPLHFGALSGAAQIHLRQGEPDRARAALERAAEINPWIVTGAAAPPPDSEEL